MRASRLQLDPPTHAGLALQRYLKQHHKEHQAAKDLIGGIEKSYVVLVYKTAFERWKASLPAAVFIEATTAGPLAIGLGNASPIENGLSIHHTYGTPYLPGSAIKGLLIRSADQHKLSEDQKKILFGDTISASHLVYWDGWLDPASSKPFQQDVITVHHRGYYTSQGQSWPTDLDDPNPVSFLSVKPGIKFCLALSSHSQGSEGWVYLAAELLKWGLENLGLGGKTNVGYGYFRVELPEKPRSEAELGLELLVSYQARIQKIKPNNERAELEFFIRELEGKAPGIRRASLEAIRQQLIGWKNWKPSNPQHARIQILLEGHL